MKSLTRRRLSPKRNLFCVTTRLKHDHAIIIGGGPVGTMQALALANQGISSKIFEQSSHPSKDPGPTFLLASGTLCLRYLGLYDEFAKISSPLRHIRSLSTRNLETELSSIDIEKSFAAINTKISPSWLRTVQRGDLVALLHEKCAENELISIEYGKQFVEYTQMSTHINVQFSDGTSARGDICIGADGSPSTVRRYWQGAEPTRNNGFTRLYCTGRLDAVPEVYQKLGDTIHCELAYRNGAMFIPNVSRNTFSLNIALKTSKPSPDAWDQVFPVEDVQKYVKQKGYSESLMELADNLDRAIQVGSNARPLLSDGWSDGRLTLVGDAAHSIFGLSGQGCNHGLCDALCLANELGQEGMGDISRSFLEFFQWRFEPTQEAASQALTAAKLNFGSGWWKAMLRDRFHTSASDQQVKNLIKTFAPKIGFDLFEEMPTPKVQEK